MGQKHLFKWSVNIKPHEQEYSVNGKRIGTDKYTYNSNEWNESIWPSLKSKSAL